MAEKAKKSMRAMPSNPDAEQSVLGAVLISADAADNIIPMLKAEDFYLSRNRIVFAAMKELQEQGKPVDYVSVADLLEMQGRMGDAGGMDYLMDLTNVMPSAANGEYYADLIKRDSLIRRVIEAGNSIAKTGYEASDGAEALEMAERLIYNIAEESSEKELLKADTALAQAYKSIQDAQSGNVPKNVINTDFPSLDRMTKGMKPGELILIAARPSVGKTAFCLNVAANACLNHQKTVAIFSLEMPAELLVKRMMSYVSKVSISKMDTRGGLNPQEKARLYKAYKALLYADLYIDDYSMNGPSEVLSKCRRLKREKGLDLIIIDYLQLMSTSSKGRSPESRQVEVSEMSRKMKIYAKELDVPIMVLSQMSRDVEKRTDDREPRLSDLRESGSIEQDADVVMFLHNPGRYKPDWPENQIVLDIKKNRNGPIGDIRLEWSGETTSFKECVDSAAQIPVPEQDSSAESAPGEDADGGLRGMREIASDSLPFGDGGADDLPFDDGDALFTADDDDEYVYDDGDYDTEE